MNSQFSKALILVGLITLSSVIYQFAQNFYEQNLFLRTSLIANQELILHGEYLSQSIAQRMSILTVMDETIQSYYELPEMRETVLRIMNALYSEKRGIRALQVFPNEGPMLLYPFSGNESVSERTLSDLLNDERPQVRLDVQRAIETREIALSGPYELRQGGLGMIARKPIFIGEEFWGFAVIVFDIPPILEMAKLEPNDETYIYDLSDSNGSFAGAGNELESPLEYTIILPDRVWLLSMEPRNGWSELYRGNLLGFRIVLTLFLVSMNILAYSLITQQNRLKNQVRERTRSLEESNVRFRESILHAPIPMVLVHNNNEMLLINERFSQCYGFDLSDIPRLEVWWNQAFKDQKYRNLVKKRWEKLVEQAKYEEVFSVGDFLIHMTAKDQSHRQVEVQITMLGKLSIYTLKDITDRINAETTQRKLMEQLNHKHRMDSLGVLAGGIAHDINNLLGAIMNSVELMTKDDIAQNAKKNYGRIILESCVRGSELTGKLLAFGRKKELKKVSINIHNLVKDIGVILKRTTTKQIDISLQCNAENHHILGDISAVQSAIMNLCINGYQAMENGGTLTIRTAAVQIKGDEQHAGYFKIQPGLFCEITIEDQGIGIDPENYVKIFDPFFTTKPIGKGSGLGLAAVYGTAVAHNGYVKVHSIPGDGSRFTLGLPIKKND